MSKWFKVATQLMAALFFVAGAMFLPFGIWLGDGPNPIFGWAIFILSVGIPWTIGYLLLRIGLRRPGSGRMASNHE